MADYDIPGGVFRKARSRAFKQFYHNWFEEPLGLIRHEIDTRYLDDLKLEERVLAIDLLRRNLRFGHAHIVEGIALLDDKESVPTLKNMLAETTNASLRLTIAGSLWRLSKDESFPEEIERMVSQGGRFLKEAHLDQILWLGDERSIGYLVDLMSEGDTFASHLALSRLNEIEDNKRYLLATDELPHQPDYYRESCKDPSFLQTMVAKLINYSPETMVMTTVGGIVSKDIRPDRD